MKQQTTSVFCCIVQVYSRASNRLLENPKCLYIDITCSLTNIATSYLKMQKIQITIYLLYVTQNWIRSESPQKIIVVYLYKRMNESLILCEGTCFLYARVWKKGKGFLRAELTAMSLLYYSAQAQQILPITKYIPHIPGIYQELFISIYLNRSQMDINFYIGIYYFFKNSCIPGVKKISLSRFQYTATQSYFPRPITFSLYIYAYELL